jgi:hypothetical protein
LEYDLVVADLDRRRRETPARGGRAGERLDARPRTGGEQHHDGGNSTTES